MLKVLRIYIYVLVSSKYLQICRFVLYVRLLFRERKEKEKKILLSLSVCVCVYVCVGGYIFLISIRFIGNILSIRLKFFKYLSHVSNSSRWISITSDREVLRLHSSAWARARACVFLSVLKKKRRRIDISHIELITCFPPPLLRDLTFQKFIWIIVKKIRKVLLQTLLGYGTIPPINT